MCVRACACVPPAPLFPCSLLQRVLVVRRSTCCPGFILFRFVLRPVSSHHGKRAHGNKHLACPALLICSEYYLSKHKHNRITRRNKRHKGCAKESWEACLILSVRLVKPVCAHPHFDLSRFIPIDPYSVPRPGHLSVFLLLLSLDPPRTRQKYSSTCKSYQRSATRSRMGLPAWPSPPPRSSSSTSSTSTADCLKLGEPSLVTRNTCKTQKKASFCGIDMQACLLISPHAAPCMQPHVSVAQTSGNISATLLWNLGFPSSENTFGRGRLLICSRNPAIQPVKVVASVRPTLLSGHIQPARDKHLLPEL